MTSDRFADPAPSDGPYGPPASTASSVCTSGIGSGPPCSNTLALVHTLSLEGQIPTANSSIPDRPSTSPCPALPASRLTDCGWCGWLSRVARPLVTRCAAVEASACAPFIMHHCRVTLCDAAAPSMAATQSRPAEMDVLVRLVAVLIAHRKS
jgi:hypothetical protein